MKKHSAIFFTFTALLTLNAFAPQMFWDQSKTTRNPASLEEDRLEELALKETPLKKLEKIKISEDRKVTSVVVDAQVQCQKDKSSALEDEIKKLVSDKESILKEIEELKKSKKEDAPKETAKADKKKEKVEVIDIMSQLTGLMVSQQAQQQMMMEQMFSMMAMPQTRQPLRQFSLNDYMPFASHYEDYSIYSATPRYPKSQSTIGISYPNYSSHDYSNPYSLYDMNNRFPSSDEGMGIQPRYNNPSAYVAPSQVPHNGFNFSNGNDMQRIQF